MIRFILRMKWKNGTNGADGEILFTIDADAPELERALTRGGMSEDGYELSELIGAEVLP